MYNKLIAGMHSSENSSKTKDNNRKEIPVPSQNTEQPESYINKAKNLIKLLGDETHLPTLFGSLQTNPSNSKKSITFHSSVKNDQQVLSHSMGPKLARKSKPVFILRPADTDLEPYLEPENPKTPTNNKTRLQELKEGKNLQLKRKNSDGGQRETDDKASKVTLTTMRSASETDSSAKKSEVPPKKIFEAEDAAKSLNVVYVFGRGKSVSNVPDEDYHASIDVRNSEDFTKTMTSMAQKQHEVKKKRFSPFDKAKSAFNGIVKRSSKPNNCASEAANKTSQTINTEEKIQETNAVTLNLDDLEMNKVDSKKIERIPSSLFSSIFKVLELLKIGAAILSVILIAYAVWPTLLFLGAHDYGDKTVLGFVNFGILGAFQGLTEIVLLYELIDAPIRKYIKEVEGSSGLINIKRFVMIRKRNFVLIILYSAGLQIGSGMLMTSVDIKVEPKSILASCLFITGIKGIIWFIVILFTTPSSILKDKNLVKKELKQISIIRQNFVEELKQTRRKLQIRELQQMYTDYRRQESQAQSIAITTQALSIPDVDLRKFSQGSYDYGKEFRLLRIQSIKVFMGLVIVYTQMFALYYLIDAIKSINSIPVDLLLVALFPLIAFIFGLFDFFVRPTSLHLTTIKVISLITAGALHRFLYLQIENKYEMMGIVAIKFAYKGIIYFLGFVYGGELMNSIKMKLKLSRYGYGTSPSEIEFSKTKFKKYTFEKFVILQKVDIFFALGTLLPIAGSQDNFGSLNFDLGLKCGDTTFYVCLVIIEAVLEIIATILFLLLVEKYMSNKKKTTKRGLIDEAYKVLNLKKLILISVGTLMLYLMFFIFLNL